jgi:hypothetical protein
LVALMPLAQFDPKVSALLANGKLALRTLTQPFAVHKRIPA